MNVLVINAGSSSLKYQLLNPDTGDLLAKGLCERIGIDGKFTYKPQVEGKEKLDAVDVAMPTHAEAIAGRARRSGGSQERRNRFHEGDRRSGPPCGPRRREVRFLRASSPTRLWLPLRSATPWLLSTTPPTSSASRPARRSCPAFPWWPCSTPPSIRPCPPRLTSMPLPYEYYENDKVRRYGFHGTSHRYVSQRVPPPCWASPLRS